MDPEENEEESVEAHIQKTRGRPRIPERWTRVFDVDDVGGRNQRTFEVKTDLLLASGLPNHIDRRSKDVWAPIFCPRKFVEKDEDPSVGDYVISEVELYETGKQVTQLRQRFRELALSAVVPVENENLQIVEDSAINGELLLDESA